MSPPTSLKRWKFYVQPRPAL